MKDLKLPAEPLFQNESDVDVILLSNEESNEDEYYSSTHCSLFKTVCWLSFQVLHDLLGKNRLSQVSENEKFTGLKLKYSTNIDW